MKPHAKKVRFDSQVRAELLELAESFDLNYIYTAVYACKIKELKLAISFSYSNKKLAPIVKSIFDSMCKELNDHNQLFPDARIDNPFS